MLFYLVLIIIEKNFAAELITMPTDIFNSLKLI